MYSSIECFNSPVCSTPEALSPPPAPGRKHSRQTINSTDFLPLFLPMERSMLGCEEDTTSSNASSLANNRNKAPRLIGNAPIAPFSLARRSIQDVGREHSGPILPVELPPLPFIDCPKKVVVGAVETHEETMIKTSSVFEQQVSTTANNNPSLEVVKLPVFGRNGLGRPLPISRRSSVAARCA